jgi:uncharacterized protein (TIGR02145 family)
MKFTLKFITVKSRIVFSALLSFLFFTLLLGQDVSLFVDGGLKIGNFAYGEPEAGTLRFNGSNFEGFNGIFWTQLEHGLYANRGPAPGGGLGEISEIYGALQIGTNLEPQFTSGRNVTPNPGTIRWSGTEFQGWNGVYWVALGGNSLYDVDGHTYKTVVIGNQEWMQENLRTSKYLSGEPIPLVSDNMEWQSLGAGAYCWYDHQHLEENINGKLYNWYAVIDSRKLCPTGWRIPSGADWVELINFLGGANVAGGKMKEATLRHWNSPNASATNESGFTGIPGGIRSFNGSFLYQGNSGSWWSSSSDGTLDVYTQSLGFNSGISGAFYNDRRSGVSVRCIRN